MGIRKGNCSNNIAILFLFSQIFSLSFCQAGVLLVGVVIVVAGLAVVVGVVEGIWLASELQVIHDYVPKFLPE